MQAKTPIQHIQNQINQHKKVIDHLLREAKGKDEDYVLRIQQAVQTLTMEIDMLIESINILSKQKPNWKL